MTITEDQKNAIIEIGRNKIGKKYSNGYKCHDFVLDIYKKVGISTDFDIHPKFSFPEILEEKNIGHLVFLRRKETKISKRITHIGIIFPNFEILHYSRWMEEERIYKVYLSSFDELFRIYDFVEFIQ